MVLNWLKARRRLKGIIFLFLSLSLLYVAGYLLIWRTFVPPEFTSARKESAMIAKEIVSMTEESLGNLDKISFEDRQYHFRKALELVRQELERAKNSRLKAIQLTQAMDKMTTAGQGIKPTGARNLAIEAARYEISLISHLIVYNDVLNSLLQTLEYKFSGDIRYDANDVQVIIKNMNQEAKEINDLNDLFNQKMSELDDLEK